MIEFAKCLEKSWYSEGALEVVAYGVFESWWRSSLRLGGEQRFDLRTGRRSQISQSLGKYLAPEDLNEETVEVKPSGGLLSFPQSRFAC